MAALLLACLAFAHPTSALAQADRLAQARSAFLHGRHDEAIRLAEPLAAARDDVQARLLLAEVLTARGDLEGALALIRKAQGVARQDDDKRAALTARGSIELLQGQHARAIATWRQALNDHPDAREARLALGKLLIDLGKKEEGIALLDVLAEDYNDGKLDESRGLTMVGVAVWRMEFYDDANTVLQEATVKDPENVEAFVAWGDLFLEKYNLEDASFAYESALKINPNHVGALLGMAQIHMEDDHDEAAIRGYLRRIFAVNPGNPDAIVLDATLQIDLEDYDGAIETLGRALKVNPNHMPAINTLATCHYLKDDSAAFERERIRAFKLNPRWAGFYTHVARFGVRVHRYQEAIDLNNKALAIDPSYWPAFVELGIGYTRIGDDAKGFEYLKKAFENDSYNIRAFNMVNLYEKTMPSYVFVERGPLRFRFHKSERPVLEAVVPELAEDAYKNLKKRYKFEPKGTVSVEIFKDAETFSVRSVGLPHITPHGICFGRVVTSRSPSEGNFNWAEVVWHELAHVFHIQKSRSRVPRWFTEGLAEYEAGVARPEWRREQEREMLVLAKEGRLWSVGRLNLGFTQAKTLNDILAAYFQSTIVIEFIVQRWGFDTILKMLDLYGQSLLTPEVLVKATGLDVAAFDEAFKAYVSKRFDRMMSSFDPSLEEYADLERFEKAHKATPADPAAMAELAMALFVARRVDEAETLFKATLKKQPGQPLANYLASIYDLRTRDSAAARGHLDAILKGGYDGYALRLQLGEVAQMEGKADEAADHLTKALAFYDKGLEALHALTEIYDKKGDKARLADTLLQITLVDQADFRTAARLLALRKELGQLGHALDAAERAINIKPFDGQLHRDMGEVSLLVGDPRKAVRSFEIALILMSSAPSALRADLLVGLARARHDAGDRKGARDALSRAEAARPDHPDIQSLRELIK